MTFKTVGYAVHEAKTALAPFHFERRSVRANDVSIEILLSPNQSPNWRLQDAIEASSGLASRLRCSTYVKYACAAHLRLKPCPYCTGAFRSLFW